MSDQSSSSSSSSSRQVTQQQQHASAQQQQENQQQHRLHPHALVAMMVNGNHSGGAAAGKRRKTAKKSAQAAAAAEAAEDAQQADEFGPHNKNSKFIEKVFEMASCADHAHALGFSDDGLSLEIRDASLLAPVLGQYFKHSNPSSFIRQLNNYGFKTISSASLGNNRHVFAHPHFKRDDASLLETITRKTAVCVKKKSKGDIIRELQHKNDDQHAQLSRMEMQHLEMFQRLMGLEAENKQLRNHLETMRRSFQETTSRMESLMGVNDSAAAARYRHHAPPPPQASVHPQHMHHHHHYQQHGMTPPPPPPPPPPYEFHPQMDFSNGHHRIAFPPVIEPPQQQMHNPEGPGMMTLNDPFHLD
jgi:hypothetical protein